MARYIFGKKGGFGGKKGSSFLVRTATGKVVGRYVDGVYIPASEEEASAEFAPIVIDPTEAVSISVGDFKKTVGAIKKQTLLEVRGLKKSGSDRKNEILKTLFRLDKPKTAYVYPTRFRNDTQILELGMSIWENKKQFLAWMIHEDEQGQSPMKLLVDKKYQQVANKMIAVEHGLFS